MKYHSMIPELTISDIEIHLLSYIHMNNALLPFQFDIQTFSLFYPHIFICGNMLILTLAASSAFTKGAAPSS